MRFPLPKLLIRVIFAYLVIAAAIVSFAKTAEARDVHALSFICCSWHHDREANYNEENYGVRYEYRNHRDDFVFTLGTFENSLNRQATFIGAGPLWEINKDLTFSLPVGFTTGYSRETTNKTAGTKPTLFAIPTINYKRVDFHFVPGVVYAVSFRLLEWEN